MGETGTVGEATWGETGDVISWTSYHEPGYLRTAVPENVESTQDQYVTAFWRTYSSNF